jgi:hypothetical protein
LISQPRAYSHDFTDYRRGPFHFEHLDQKTEDYSHQRRGISAPLWLIATVFALWPLATITLATRRRNRKQHRIAEGLCPWCGYDLRASPDRCPECGTKVKKNQPGPFV